MAIFPATAIPSAAADFTLDQSLKFNNDADSAYLSKTFASAGNQKTWSYSVWFKIGKTETGDSKMLFGGVNENNHLRLDNQQRLQIYAYIPSVDYGWISAPQLRDSSAWYHALFVTDTTNATAAQRQRIYLNGVELTDRAVDYGNPPEDYDGLINSAAAHEVGGNVAVSNEYWDGYMAEMHFIDGTALTPTSFGETGDYGEWKPKKVAGLTYGTNGFYLPFENESTKHTVTAVGNAQHTTSVTKVGASTIAFDGTGDYLTIPASNAFEITGDFTIEMWCKKNTGGAPSHEEYLISNMKDPLGFYIFAQTDGGLYFAMRNADSGEDYKGFTLTFDTDWHHLAVVRKDNVYKIYFDGVDETLDTDDTIPNDQKLGTSTEVMLIGTYAIGYDKYWDGHMDEIRISNMARYTSGFTPSTSAFTEDGNTLLLIHSNTSDASTTFTDSSGVSNGLGTDSSGEGNDWTANNLSADDQMVDSPTNNFATWNPLNMNGTLAEGNLQITTGDSSKFGTSSTMGFTDVNVYAEFLLKSTDQNNGVGIDFNPSESGRNNDHGGENDNSWAYLNESGAIYHNNSSLISSGYATYGAGDIIGVAVKNDKVYFSINGTWQNSSNPATEANGVSIDANKEWFFAYSDTGTSDGCIAVANFGQDSSFAGEKTAQGNQDGNSIGDFYYTPPTDFLALCTSNLPAVAVTPSEHFNTVLYTGNGSSDRDITGVGFQPDFTWIKDRTSTNWHDWTDVVRGGTKALFSNATNAELVQADGNKGFISDGFTIGSNYQVNRDTYTYVSWNWKANGSGSSNEDGTINTTATSANVDAGFSISTYTGTGDNATIGHGLSVAPEMVIVKCRSHSGDWAVYRTDLGAANNMRLHSDAAVYSASTMWNSTASTADVFSIGTNGDVNTNTRTYLAYAFHSVDGYSKFGKWVSDENNPDFVYLGFRPQYVVVKSVTTSEGWVIFDSARSPYNLMDDFLYCNGTNAETVDYATVNIDMVSNGFVVRGTNSSIDDGTRDFIYLAFAETPFKYSNAR